MRRALLQPPGIGLYSRSPWSSSPRRERLEGRSQPAVRKDKHDLRGKLVLGAASTSRPRQNHDPQMRMAVGPEGSPAFHGERLLDRREDEFLDQRARPGARAARARGRWNEGRDCSACNQRAQHLASARSRVHASEEDVAGAEHRDRASKSKMFIKHARRSSTGIVPRRPRGPDAAFAPAPEAVVCTERCQRDAAASERDGIDAWSCSSNAAARDDARHQRKSCWARAATRETDMVARLEFVGSRTRARPSPTEKPATSNSGSSRPASSLSPPINASGPPADASNDCRRDRQLSLRNSRRTTARPETTMSLTHMATKSIRPYRHAVDRIFNFSRRCCCWRRPGSGR